MEGPLCLVSYLVVQPSVGYKTTYMRTSPKSWLTSGLQLGERPSSSTPKLCRLNPKSHQFFVEPAINKPTSQQANKPTKQDARGSKHGKTTIGPIPPHSQGTCLEPAAQQEDQGAEPLCPTTVLSPWLRMDMDGFLLIWN